MITNNQLNSNFYQIAAADNDGNVYGVNLLGPTDLGDVANISIAGGNLNEFLTTDGAGTLSWSIPILPDKIINGTSNVSVALNGNISFSVNGTEEMKVSTNGVELKGYTESVDTIVVSSGTYAPDVSLRTIVNISAQGNFTFNGFTNPVAGQSGTFIITQDATGSRLMTSNMRFAGALKTLSTAANTRDILSVFYNGIDYYAVLTKDFR